ncbi:MAG TPA: cytochrome c biogenesis protein CcsA [Phycisphaerae bacterium]|nr:cytochrome c biogenesis protein CcsA [Phycisphaerae bacterium]
MRSFRYLLAAIAILLAALFSPGVRNAFALSMDQADPRDVAPAPEEAQSAAAAAAAANPAAEPQFGVKAAGATAADDASSLSAMPVTPAQRAAFEKALNLSDFRKLAIQHNDQLKIIDSWARQSLSAISHRQSLPGKDPVVSALDLVFRQSDYLNENLIYITSVPIREDLAKFAATPEESARIIHEARVSFNFLTRREVEQELDVLAADSNSTKAVGELQLAMETFAGLGSTLHICPPDAAHRNQPWHYPVDLWANFPEGQKANQARNLKAEPIPGYSADQARRVWLAIIQMRDGWGAADPVRVNAGMAQLVALLPTIDPQGYPSITKRSVELWYNRFFDGTILDVFAYLVALTLFLLVAVGVNQRLEKPAIYAFAFALAIHIAATAVRWWLAGRIPIKNEFESVLGSALLGCCVGFILELWKRNGIFGMAFSFVGFLAMTACFTFPYVLGTDIGQNVGKVAGILDSYWLYIHVNIVIASYALIAATFCIGLVYLLVKQWFWINPIEPAFDDAPPADPLDSGPGGAAVALHSRPSALSTQHASIAQLQSQRQSLLSVLDGANIVILQMATWFLGIGIICGAVWADHSWGRPWGWDPKETFALVTWIVYLIIVHLRLVTKNKADWTAWLSIVGFGVMMFNWIGVNFLLVGLHSYA